MKSSLALFLASAMTFSLAATAQDGQWRSDVFVMRLDGTENIRITDDVATETRPSWSPDGKLLAYSSIKRKAKGSSIESATIFIHDFATGTASEFLPGPDKRSDPAFSPDGKRMAFVSDREGGLRVYVAKLDGSEVKCVTPDPPAATYYYLPAWSSDGMHLAFASGTPQGRSWIWMADLTEGSVAELDLPENREYFFPTWHPAKDELLLCYRRRSGDPFTMASYHVPHGELVDLREPIVMTRGPATPSYFPDGQKIIMAGRGPPPSNDVVYAWTPGAEEYSIVPESFAGEASCGVRHPVASPDGEHIAYVSGDWFLAHTARRIAMQRASLEAWEQAANIVTWAMAGARGELVIAPYGRTNTARDVSIHETPEGLAVQRVKMGFPLEIIAEIDKAGRVAYPEAKAHGRNLQFAPRTWPIDKDTGKPLVPQPNTLLAAPAGKDGCQQEADAEPWLILLEEEGFFFPPRGVERPAGFVALQEKRNGYHFLCKGPGWSGELAHVRKDGSIVIRHSVAKWLDPREEWLWPYLDAKGRITLPPRNDIVQFLRSETEEELRRRLYGTEAP